MKPIHYILTVLTAIAIATGCCPCKKLKNQSERIVKDSVWTKVETKWRDSIIQTPVDSVAIMAMVKCPDNGVINIPVVTKKNKQATVTAGVVNNKLIAHCKCDALEMKVKLQETSIEKYRLAIDKYKNIQVISKKYIPDWIKVLAGVGVAALVLLAIKIYLKIIKPI